MKLKGRCAIVTGGATDIGLATCKRLLKEGVIVTIWDLNLIALDQAHQELAQYGKIFLQSCDVTKIEFIIYLELLQRRSPIRQSSIEHLSSTIHMLKAHAPLPHIL